MLLYFILGILLIIVGVYLYNYLSKMKSSDSDVTGVNLIGTSIIIVIAGFLLILMGLGVLDGF